MRAKQSPSRTARLTLLLRILECSLGEGRHRRTMWPRLPAGLGRSRKALYLFEGAAARSYPPRRVPLSSCLEDLSGGSVGVLKSGWVPGDRDGCASTAFLAGCWGKRYILQTPARTGLPHAICRTGLLGVLRCWQGGRPRRLVSRRDTNRSCSLCFSGISTFIVRHE
jgi:hypothetical protein